MNVSSKQTKDEKKEELERLDIWQSIDTWDIPQSVWEKNQKTVVNPWRVNSTDDIDLVIKGRPAFPYAKYLGRTPLRWIQIIVFYIIFYLILFLFTLFCYFIFNHFIRPENEPMYTDILAKHRGLFTVPNLTLDYDLRLVYNDKAKSDMDNFFKKYSNQAGGVDCSFENPAPPGGFCKFDIDQLGPCAPPYEKKCFILRLNRIFNWEPKAYENSLELPKFMPADLKMLYESTPPSRRAVVWTSCYIPKKKDKKFVKSLQYHPSHSSFPGYYFPFITSNNYVDPLVAVEIDIEEGSKVYIKCRNWAKNIDNTKYDLGTIDFKYTVE